MNTVYSAVSIQKETVMQKSRVLLDYLRLAHSIGNRIAGAADLEQILSETVKRMGEQFQYEGICIALIGGDGVLLCAWSNDFGQTHQLHRQSIEPSGNPSGEEMRAAGLTDGVMTRADVPLLSRVPHILNSRSSLGVPIRNGNRIIGLLDIESQETNAFDDYDRHVLEFLASQIAMAVGKNRLLNLERKKTEYLSLVSDVGRQTAGVLTVPELSRTVARLIHQHFAYSSVGVFLVDTVRPVLVLQSVSGEYSEVVRNGYEQPLHQGILGYVMQTRKPFMTNDVRNDPRYFQPLSEMDATRSELCVPLRIGDRVIGVIDVQNTQTGRFFDEVDLLAMTALSGQVAIALDNARLFQDLKKSMEEQTRLQEQLIQSEKLSALGQLVAGVVHELNNPLTAIIGFADLTLERTGEAHTRQALDRIAQESRRMAQIVKHLLAFARKERPVQELVNLNELVRDVIRLRAYNMRVTNIQIIEQYDPNLPATYGDPNQLRQVFLNIISNAEYAIRQVHSRGWITIRTSCEKQGSTRIMRVAIQDSGPGISEAHIAKIFDPFFTTKQAGHGTGLGLSISYGIVQEHGGRLLVESPPNEGACFTVELPVRTEAPQGEEDEAQMPVAPQLSGKRILVVDDEKDILDYITQALKINGHTVDTAVDGTSALRRIGEIPYDVIISDLKMPGISGRRLYETIRHQYPHLLSHVVLMTGDVISVDVQQFLAEINIPYLEKPFTFSQLEQSIASVFNRKSTP